MRGGISERSYSMEKGDKRGEGGVTWHRTFLWVSLRHVFGMVTAFTLMMQYPCLPASRRRRVLLCHHQVGPYQSVTKVCQNRPGPAQRIKVPQSLLPKQLAATLTAHLL